MGKSNLFRFLVAHPTLKQHYLGDAAARYDFVLVDCNLVDPRSEEALLDELDEQLDRAGMSLPDAPASPRAHSLRRSIQRRLEWLEPGRVAVLLLDPLDQSFRLLDPHFWAYLRGLRDLHGNLVFVLGARRMPTALIELEELFTGACKRLGIEFSSADRVRLLQLTAGHPGLLKNAAELVGRGQVLLDRKGDADRDALLSHEPVQKVCAELCSDLDPEQLKALKWIAWETQSGDVAAPAGLFLERAGLVRKTVSGGWEIASSILGEYVRAHARPIVHVIVEPFPFVRLQSWQGETLLELTEAHHELLSILSRDPTQPHPRAHLARLLFSGAPDTSRSALEQRIKRLRGNLNGALVNFVGDKDFNSILSPHRQGIRLNLKSRSGWEIAYQLKS
jgi:hypothetical protein